MRKKKILFLGALDSQTKDGSVGGTFIACSSLYDHLQNIGYNIVKLNTTYKIKSVAKIPLFRKFITLVKRNIEFYYKVLRHYDAKAILIFLSAGNSYLEKAPIAFLSKKLGKKVIIFPRSGYLLADYDKTIYKKTVNKLFEKADRIICQSEFWKDFFKNNNVEEKKLTVIENWYPHNKIEKSIDLSFPNIYCLGEPLKVVFVARLEENKGIIDLIMLANTLNKDKLNFHIDIFGEGDYKDHIFNMIKEYNLSEKVFIKGWLNNDDKLKTINQYHLAIFTSRFEGYPNTLLDYIFAKVPILATNIDSAKAVGNNLITYYIPGNYQDMKNKLKYIINNYSRVLENAKLLFEEKSEKNNINYTTKKLLKILNDRK